MFAWLGRLFGGSGTPTSAARKGRSAPKPAAATKQTEGAAVGGVPATAQGAPRHAPPTPARSSEERYIDTLARELGELTELTRAEEQRTSQLVEAISTYVNTHAIDPPVMPALASRMLELLHSEEVDVVALARLIERDQATSAKLMSIANSAMFKGKNEIESVRDAIVFLGTEQVTHIAIGLASRALFEAPVQHPSAHGAERWERLFNHAMTTAFAACHLASQRNRRHCEPAFVGGLFHDVGKAVALRALTELIVREKYEVPSELVIDAALQLIHAEPTTALYSTWQLPRQLMAMCQHHHRLGLDTAPELHFVRIASGLDALRVGTLLEKRDALQEIDESAAALRMTDAQLRVANTETFAYGERVRQMFS